jgi:hypothetical protein
MTKSLVIVLPNRHSDDEINDNKMGEAYGTHEEEEKHIKIFGGGD